VTDRGRPRVLKGRYESDQDELIPSPTQGEALDGRVTWQAADRFAFQLRGGGPDDPGLTSHEESPGIEGDATGTSLAPLPRPSVVVANQPIGRSFD
jgi:hypothetical protein